MANYTVYKGKFICHECKKEVLSLRCYPDTKELTWMCQDKHVSRVNLGKRKKIDYDS